MRTTVAKTEGNLAKLCEAACGHARVGKFRAAEIALDDAREIATVLGLSYRLRYPTMVLDYCRRTIRSTEAPRVEMGNE